MPPIIESFFRSALKVICPKTLVEVTLADRPIGGMVHIVGFGKGAAGMVSGVINSVGDDKIVAGIVSVPIGTFDTMKKNDRLDLWPSHPAVLTFEVAKDNLPDDASAVASGRILDYCRTLTAADQLIVCCSGGGSACLSLPAEGLSVKEKHNFVKLVAGRGATIEDLNRIRGRLSRTKSGRLIEAALPAAVTTLILSDIIGDPPHLIGSGPTIPFDEDVRILDLLQKYQIEPESKIKNILLSNPPPKLSYNPNFRIIGRNRVALDEIARLGKESGFDSIILGDTLSGEARLIGSAYADMARYLRGMIARSQLERSISSVSFPSGTLERVCSIKKGTRPLLLIAGGEPTVTLKGAGRGGRNQELALSFSESSTDLLDVTFLSGGTDGQDGPCDAAGAWVRSNDKIPGGHEALNNNDSFNLFQNCRPDQHIKTGLTFTNVMDIHILQLN